MTTLRTARLNNGATLKLIALSVLGQSTWSVVVEYDDEDMQPVTTGYEVEDGAIRQFEKLEARFGVATPPAPATANLFDVETVIKLNQAKADIESGRLYSEAAKACIGAAHREMNNGNEVAVKVLTAAAYVEEQKAFA